MACINYITGASGFLGTHLMEKIAPLNPDGSRFNTVTIPHQEISHCKLQPFENFFFLSAYGNMFDQKDEGKTIQANLLDLLYIMNQAREFNFKSFVYISTSSVTLPVQTTYSRTKKVAENVLLEYIKRFNFPIAIIRLFSMTGVGEQEEHLIPKLISSCMHDEKIDFVPEPRHDFVDVEDAVTGILYLSKNQKQGIFEIGNGRAYSNKEVLELVQKCTGYDANVRLVKSMRPYDLKKWKSTKNQWFKKLKPRTLEQTITNMVKEHGD